MTSLTKEFCRHMGIYPLKGKESAMNPEEAGAGEETHYFAFLSQVRQSFNKKTSFQNPEVLCPAKDMPKLAVAAYDKDLCKKSFNLKS
mmetsp:Transcript_17671/g.23861  ORF Transcript_17671/g.23861 Transcript_17671/m.23861 type:complete len:88 (-) Transcript_17671:1317-1580(-)|eukprot:CAMPEP_0185591968 /NCGR_PEP_ID=MMETSP0434-20130131/66384_1 /TAXON_ID=626734 ORGANISM="Favella taraikaensis, Strain Fe Narragansett Bay" /NCGR_SAMPLE_ID=MMETSP0434 /ASSEMBLY_ACC=CAM_ASM_000379 /LENGTH=87 /DNA_ID=CAMNT_0028217419 /DNA_START=1179 /DNA_END=1442 /DNA_ORIENTATION=+